MIKKLLEIVGHRTVSNWTTAVKLHMDQLMRNRNFRARSDVVERGSVTKSHKGDKACVEKKVEECFQWKAHVSHKLLVTKVEKVKEKKDDRLLLHLILRQSRLTARDKNSHRDQAIKRKPQWIKMKFHADSDYVKIHHVSSGHPAVCENYKSEKGCIYGDKCHFQRV